MSFCTLDSTCTDLTYLFALPPEKHLTVHTAQFLDSTSVCVYMYIFIATCVDFLLWVKGKTLLAKAVANQTSATFLRVVGSELIPNYLADGPKLVR